MTAALLGLAAYVGTVWLVARIFKVCQNEIDGEKK